MHEFGIASDLLEAALVEADRIGGGFPSVIGVRLGGDIGIDLDALQTSFEALVAHRELGDLSLEIEPVPAQCRCECGEVFDVLDLLAVCPICGSCQSERIPGPGLSVSFLEFDEKETPAGR